mmetsp:Transcript_73406/g.215236  ORF Transcript_73406/g.215236 Transcript_73406/m.215236 type:complete len:216 (-) Transcript_73406:138-785(-)
MEVQDPRMVCKHVYRLRMPAAIAVDFEPSVAARERCDWVLAFLYRSAVSNPATSSSAERRYPPHTCSSNEPHRVGTPVPASDVKVEEVKTVLGPPRRRAADQLARVLGVALVELLPAKATQPHRKRLVGSKMAPHRHPYLFHFARMVRSLERHTVHSRCSIILIGHRSIDHISSILHIFGDVIPRLVEVPQLQGKMPIAAQLQAHRVPVCMIDPR